jgi:hypothetical protein
VIYYVCAEKTGIERKYKMNSEKICEISADMVTIEVVDKVTGKTYRHELPIDYYETANCVKLKGENLQGQPSELVFYSGTGLSRLKDLTGLGPDKDPCGSHK